MRGQVLIVDDEPLVCRSLSEVIHRAGYKVSTANDGFEALEAIQQERFSVVVVDMNMPKMDGLEVLKRVKAMVPDIAVIIITGYATIASAVEAMKYGACDYIPKPFSPSRINTVIEKAINSAFVPMEKTIDHPFIQQNIITADPQMLDILSKIRLVAQSDSNVMIQGESGTGKELIARAIHRLSSRADGPYVAVNCAAIPEGLLESELFGHEKGSFTGAIARQIGKIELAHNGTLLLDEISEMAKPFQAKLLRFTQEREIIRIGGTHQLKVDVRIITTSNKDIPAEVEKGRFREDLFYRLCVIPIFLPPLRERKDDIPVLAQYFAKQISARMGKQQALEKSRGFVPEVGNLSPEVLETLKSYSWPGNVRELENTIERAIALSNNGAILLDNISFSIRKEPSKYISLEVGTSIEDAERELIIRTLEDVGGNKQKAAEILGITSKTIRSKLRQYGYSLQNSQ